MPDGLTIAPGTTFYPNLEWTVSGLVGTLGVRITRDSDGATVLARSTAGITEFGSSGEYTATLVAPTTAGEYTIRWDDGATTVGHVASEGLTVTYSAGGVAVASGTDLCAVSDVKAAMEQQVPSTTLDTLIQTYITAASRMIENRYMRDFAPVASATYTFKVIGYMVDLTPHDLRTATTITLDPNGTPVVLASTQYRLSPSGAESNLGTYTAVVLSRLQNLWSTSVTNYGYTELSILGAWGPAALNDDVRRACALTVASWISAKVSTGFQLDDLTSGDATLRPDRFGGFAIPLGAHMILDQYSRPTASFA